jgi:hypothetical protein
MKNHIMRLVALTVVLATISAPAIARKQYLDMDGETTHDGLYRVKRSVMDAAWARPDINLGDYDKLLVVSAGLQYRPVKDVSRSAARSGNVDEFPIDADQRENMGELVREIFIEELSDLERFTIVDEPGPGVLILHAGILDIVSRVPPEPMGRGEIYLRSTGEATLVLEFRDAPSNAVLVRVADRRSAEQRGIAMPSNPVSNTSNVRSMVAQWARILRKSLDRIVVVDAEGKVTQEKG